MTSPMRGMGRDQRSPEGRREPPPAHRTAGEPDRGRDERRGDAGEKAGLYEKHRWLVPVTVVASIVGAFLAMILLTWAAGGWTLFG